ncbi:MAG TPA: hypothetical protein PLO89_04980 [Spirochaetota bacterium]|nr:hypothetical protein [Spirochaetota bacterium]
MTVQELKNSITKGNIENIYLFSGSESGEKNEVIRLMEEKIFGKEPPMKYTFYCDKELDPENFIDALNSNLLFAESKMVILKRVESIDDNLVSLLEKFIIPHNLKDPEFETEILKKTRNEEQKKSVLAFYEKKENNVYSLKKLKEADKKKLVGIFENIGYSAVDKNTFLIMLNETADKIPNGLTNLLNQRQNIVFWEMFENQKQNWIRMEFKKHNLFIEDTAIDFIMNAIENNKQQFENEIQKIVFAFPSIKDNDKNVVTKDVLEDFIFHSKEESPFSLYSALLEKNLENALDILNKLFLSDEKSILNGIVWSHKRFIKMIDLYENEGKTPEEIFSINFINSKKAKEEYVKGLNNYSFNALAKLFYKLSELDYYLKAFPDDLKLIKLQEFVIDFIRGEKAESFLSGDLIVFQTP